MAPRPLEPCESWTDKDRLMGRTTSYSHQIPTARATAILNKAATSPEAVPRRTDAAPDGLGPDETVAIALMVFPPLEVPKEIVKLDEPVSASLAVGVVTMETEVEGPTVMLDVGVGMTPTALGMIAMVVGKAPMELGRRPRVVGSSVKSESDDKAVPVGKLKGMNDVTTVGMAVLTDTKEGIIEDTTEDNIELKMEVWPAELVP